MKDTLIQILDNSYAEITRPASEEDSWDRDDTYENHLILGFKIIDNNKNHHDFKVPFPIDHNKEYYLVAVYYDTGDTFGHDANRVQFVAFLEDANKASEIKQLILQDYKEKGGGYSLDLEFNENGEATNTVSCYWKGYFESLNEVEVHRVKSII